MVVSVNVDGFPLLPNNGERLKRGDLMLWDEEFVYQSI